MDVRFTTTQDIPLLMRFIDEHWARGHVLATSRRLMDWQHRGTDDRDLDYVLAAEGDEILGVLGFVATSRFDPALASSRTVWLTLWKARRDAPSGTGLRLLTFLARSVPHELIGTVGINAEVARLYRALGYQVGHMRQWYVLHPSRHDFSLVRVPEGHPRNALFVDAPPLTLQGLDAAGLQERAATLEQAWPAGTVPRKSARFFETRFLQHPFYRYQVHALERGSRTVGLVVTRLCMVNGARVLRVVDGILPPDALPGLGAALQGLLVEHDAECADLLESGLDTEGMGGSGLLPLDDLAGDVVIPSYYEPFVQKNVQLSFACKPAPGQRLVVFKADADQDRPNRVEEPPAVPDPLGT